MKTLFQKLKRKSIAIGIAAAITGTLLSATSQAWVETRSYEGLRDGANPTYTVGENNTQGPIYKPDFRVYGSSAVAHNGRMSLRMNHLGGVNTYTNRVLSAVTPNQPDLKEGSELWVSAWFYFPPGFVFNARPKLMRLYPLSYNMSNFYVGMGSGAGALPEGGVQLIAETIPGAKVYWVESDAIYKKEPNVYGDDSIKTHTIQPGKWTQLEMYVYLSSDPARGKLRLWKDDKLLFDVTRQTFTGVDVRPNVIIRQGTGPLVVFWANWENAPSPKTQDSFLDDIVMTNDPAQARVVDAKGNRRLGPNYSSPTIREFVPVVEPSEEKDGSGFNDK